MILETSRLRLRKIKKEDTDIIFSLWMQDEKVSKFMFWKASKNKEDTFAFVNMELNNISNPNWNRWIIELIDTNEIIGTCLLFYNKEESHYDISYNLGKKYWNKGYAFEAMKRVIDYAKEIGIKRIETSYAKENIASGRLLNKLGFKITKEISFVCSNGELVTKGNYVILDIDIKGENMVDKLIAYCGLDCSKCEAYIATQTNDEKLKEEVAKQWSELNRIEITKEMINCDGCRMDGRKTPFCDSLCPIKNCGSENKVDTCGACDKLDVCQKIKMIISNNKEAYERLKNIK